MVERAFAGTRRGWNSVGGGLVVSQVKHLEPSFLRPLTPEQSCQCLERWFRSPYVRAITPGPGHLEELLREVKKSGVGGNLTTDAHLVALAREYHAVIHTADVDFSRFPGLRWKNPLKEKRI